MPDAATRRHLERVAALGCIACMHDGHYHVEAEIHHIRAGHGMSQRASDYLTIPLCPDHHRNGGHGTAIHAGQRAFEARYGSELDLLAETFSMLSEAFEMAMSGRVIAERK